MKLPISHDDALSVERNKSVTPIKELGQHRVLLSNSFNKCVLFKKNELVVAQES